jgi:hypothetical protein
MRPDALVIVSIELYAPPAIMVYQIGLEEPMGSQVNFFLGPNDLRQLASVLSKSGELVFWRADPRTALLQEVTDIVPTYGVDTLQLQLARRADFQQVLHLFSRASSGYSSDLSLYQPVVEFDLPYVAKGYIRSGRVYRQDAYWNPNDEHERKEEEWIRWAKQLFSSVRRSLTKIDGTHSYAGKEAIEMRAKGILFQEIDDPRNEFCS